MKKLEVRETHLVSGLFLQLAVILAIGYLFTQAIRDLRSNRLEYIELKKQIRAARVQAAQGVPVSPEAEAQLLNLKSNFALQADLTGMVERLQSVARDQFDFEEIEVILSQEAKPLAELSDQVSSPLPLEAHALQFRGRATSWDAAKLLAFLNQQGLRFITPLVSLQIQGEKVKGTTPVEAHMEWLVPMLIQEKIPKWEPTVPPVRWGAIEKPNLKWGPRIEPFLTPFLYAGVLEKSQQALRELKLSQIRLDPQMPTCIINGKNYGLNDSVNGYRLILITPRAVLLERGQEEVFLTLPLSSG